MNVCMCGCLTLLDSCEEEERTDWNIDDELFDIHIDILRKKGRKKHWHVFT